MPFSGVRTEHVRQNQNIPQQNDIAFDVVFLVVGIFLVILGLGMLVPAAVDLAFSNPDWQVFALCALLVIFTGGMFFLSSHRTHTALTIKQGFLITVCSWTAIPAFGALPFVFSDLNLSYADAFFEAMSGVTTTGSTVITGLDNLPPGILLWRSLLQWFGGVGIIVMGISILPMLKIGGMQLFKVEAFDLSHNFIPRSRTLATSLSLLYVGLTLLCALVLWVVGMTPFEAICHAFTTISTGGFSTSDSSIGHFDSPTIDYCLSCFMIAGSLPFILFLRLLRGDAMALYQDSQVRWFLITLFFIIALLVGWLCHTAHFTFFTALRYSVFNVISVITGTGFASTDYGSWGAFATILFFFIMFIGGCAGSTSCGIKIFRFQIMFVTAKSVLRKIIQPHVVQITRYNNSSLDNQTATSVFVFLFLFITCLIMITFALTLTGLDFTTALSGAGTALSNVGPGIGRLIGPAGNFQALSENAKWLLSFAMLLGRLELFAILVLLSPLFWRA